MGADFQFLVALRHACDLFTSRTICSILMLYLYFKSHLLYQQLPVREGHTVSFIQDGQYLEIFNEDGTNLGLKVPLTIKKKQVAIRKLQSPMIMDLREATIENNKLFVPKKTPYTRSELSTSEKNYIKSRKKHRTDTKIRSNRASRSDRIFVVVPRF